MKWHSYEKKAGAWALAVVIFVMSLNLPALAYQPNGWPGAIQWSTHGALLGHYATSYSTEQNYSRGLLCLDPEKGADPDYYGYGTESGGITYGYNESIARIAYLSKVYANTNNSYKIFLATWAVGTGLVYDVVEGSSAWGEPLSGTSEVSLSYYQAARNWIVERLEHFDVLPEGLHDTAASASASPIEMTKQADGSFTCTMPASEYWTTDRDYYGFIETEGSSGTMTLGGASLQWSRNGSSITFTVSASEVKKWAAGGGNSGVLTLNKRIGDADSDRYEVWLPGSTNNQQMVYVQASYAAHPEGYLAFHAEVEPGHAYFTKMIESDTMLTNLCSQYYSLDGTEITVYDAGLNVVSVLKVTNGKTPTIDLEPGTYYYEETKAAAGFVRKTGRTVFTVASGETFTAQIKNQPKFDPMGFVLTKQGRVNGQTQPLEGAEFTVYYFTDNTLTVSEALVKTTSASRTWVLKSDSAGVVQYDDTHKIRGDALFKNEAGQYVGLPGTYLFVETKAPDGFETCDPFVANVKVNEHLGVDNQVNSKTITDENEYGYACILKRQGSDETLTQMAPDFYDLDGAEFTVYYHGTMQIASDRDGNDVVLTVTNGKTDMVCLAAGIYDVKETKAGTGYALNTGTFTLTVSKDNTENTPAWITVENTPLFDSWTLLLKKVARVQGMDDQPLQGAVFEVSYYNTLGEVEGLTPTAAWYFASDNQGEILYDEDHLAEGYSSDPLFVTEAGDIVGLPGSYRLVEVKVPVGYVAASEQVVTMDPSAPGYGTTSVYQAPIFTDQPQTIYLRIVKVNAADGTTVAPGLSSYAGAEFDILGYDLMTGDYVILGHVTTDAEGQATFQVPNPVSEAGPFYTTYFVRETRASEGCLINTELFAVNPGLSEAEIPEIFHEVRIPESPISITVTKVEKNAAGISVPVTGAKLSLVRVSDGLVVDSWTSDGSAHLIEGIPAGDYEIREDETPEGFLPLTNPVSVTVMETTYVENTEVVNERIPTVATRAAFDTGSKMSLPEEEAVIVDEVPLNYLTVGEEYLLKASIVNAEDPEKVYAQGTLHFVAEEMNEVRNVSLTVDLTAVDEEESASGSLVVFEQLYQVSRSEEVPVAVHEEAQDEDQQVTIPRIRTVAVDGSDEDKVVASVGTQTIVDTILYENLLPGQSYVVEGTLMDALTGLVLTDEEGNPLAQSRTFTPENSHGSITLEFEVDGSVLSSKTVVFEKLYDGEVLIGRHEELSDEGQSVYAPSLQTQVTETTMGCSMVPLGTVELVDTVSFENLIPNTEYVVHGTLMVKEENQALIVDDSEVKASTAFTTPEAAEGESAVSGSVEVVFRFSSEGLEGKTLVVFESCVRTETGIIEAVHEDINDPAQTVYVPWIGTQASVDGSKTFPQKATSITITDTVSYENLTPGKNYHLVAAVVDQTTGKVLLTEEDVPFQGELTFQPKESTGSVEVTITLDVPEDALTLVVFEKLYVVEDEEILIACHEDIHDKDQSVKRGVDTGDVMRLGLYVFLSVISAVGLIVLIRIRKRKGNEQE